MTRYTFHIEKVTPEIREMLAHLQTLPGVTSTSQNDVDTDDKIPVDIAALEGPLYLNISIRIKARR